MTTFTKSDVAQLSAGDELDERVCLAIEAMIWIPGPWPQPTAADRLRRLLGLPSPHPNVGNPSVYCGPAWSTMDPGDLQEAFDEFDMTYPEQQESVAMCIWFVQEVMTELGMD